MPRTSPLSSAVFHAACALSAPSGHLPLEGKAAIRESPLLKKVAHHPCEPIRSPSTVIPSAAEGSLLHCRHMHTCALTQTTPWCFLFRLSLAHDLPVCKKDPSTSVGMTGGRLIASHSFFTPLRGSILCLWRGPFGLTGRRLNGQARRLFGLGQTRKSLCGTSVSKGLLVSSE